MLKYLIPFLCMLTSCTMSLTNITTEGKADDVADVAQTASPDVKADVNASLTKP